MNSNKLTNKRRSVTLAKLIMSLSILLCLLISCNWNSSEQKDSERAALDKEEKLADEDSSYIVDVTAVDYAFGMPSEIPSGWVTFRMKNMGKEEHLGIVDKYPDSLGYKGLSGMISEALKQDGMEGFSPMLGLREGQFGGPAMLSPELTGETTVFLEPGLYAFTCWVKTPDGELHLQKGMIRPFLITNDKTGADKPKSTVDITMTDFAINVEDPIGKGEQVFNVKFEESHNIHMARLEPDQDLEDLKEWMNHITAPSPFKFIGGAEPAPEGMSSTFKATLEPGRYAFATFGRAIHGMAEEFTIPETGMVSVKGHETVNEKVYIESNMEKTIIPEKIPAGRTLLAIKNTGSEDYNYFISSLKKGFTLADFKEYNEGVFVFETIRRDEVTSPENFIWQGTIEAGKQETLNLEVKKKEYVIVGPILPGMPLKTQWRDENMYHSMEGVGNENLE